MGPNYCLRKSKRALRHHPLLLSHHQAIRSLASIWCAFPTLTTWGEFLVLSDTSLPQALPPCLWGFVPTKGFRFPLELSSSTLSSPETNKVAMTPNSIPAPSLNCFALKSVGYFHFHLPILHWLFFKSSLYVYWWKNRAYFYHSLSFFVNSLILQSSQVLAQDFFFFFCLNLWCGGTEYFSTWGSQPPCRSHDPFTGVT